MRSDNEAVAINLDIEPVEKPETVLWVDPVHRDPDEKKNISRTVIASETPRIAPDHLAKQSIARRAKGGLLRRFAPRNDEERLCRGSP